MPLLYKSKLKQLKKSEKQKKDISLVTLLIFEDLKNKNKIGIKNANIAPYDVWSSKKV